MFSKRARVDGQWQAMPSDFPKLKAGATTSTSATVVVRIPKPSDPTASVMYDPTMSDSGSAASAATQPAVALTTALLLAVAAVVASARSEW